MTCGGRQSSGQTNETPSADGASKERNNPVPLHLEVHIRLFRDRHDAGLALADLLKKLALVPPSLVLALPRGGVPVGFELAQALKAELDICPVRKLGLPGDEELAFGAISAYGNQYVNDEIVSYFRLSLAQIQEVIQREREQLQRQCAAYRQSRPLADVQGRTVILTDDGLATGATMTAALAGILPLQPDRIVIAVPVAARPTYEVLRNQVDTLIALARPHPFSSVGAWYQDFSPVSDADIARLLEDASPQRLLTSDRLSRSLEAAANG